MTHVAGYGVMYAGCHVVVTYAFQCARCETGEVQTYSYMAGEMVMWVVLPQGWHVVDGKPYCPQHTLEIGA